MQVAIELVGLYLAIAFPVIVGARVFTGTNGAKRTARFLFLRGPVALVIGTFWLFVDGALFFFPRRISDAQPFVEEPIMPVEPRDPQPEDNSLRAKLNKMERERMELMMNLTGGELPEPTLRRAYELGLIEDIAVRREHVVTNATDGEGAHHDSDTCVTSLSFVLRTPPVRMSSSKGESDE